MKFKVNKERNNNKIILCLSQIWKKQKMQLQRIYNTDIILYFILIPFFYPRGFSEKYPIYKYLFTLWLYISLLVVLGLFIYMYLKKKLVNKKFNYYMFAYFALFIVITFITQGSITQGLQKLFAAPVLCILCMIYLENNKDRFLRVSSNIIIVVFTLSLTIFNPAIMRRFIKDEHIILFGHVQIVAPLGVLAIFLSFLIFKRNAKHKAKAIVLSILSVLVMLSSQTFASKFSILFLLLSIILLFLKRSYKIFELDVKVYIGIYIILNILLGYYSVKGYGVYAYGLDFSFSGRTFVWREAVNLFKKHFLIGYGAYGVLIKTFWSKGMNYAHNEFFQRLLDGGIILCTAFYAMLYSYTSQIKKSKNKCVLHFSNMCFSLMLLIMIFESVTEYYYFFVFMSLLAYLPELIDQETVEI